MKNAGMSYSSQNRKVNGGPTMGGAMKGQMDMGKDLSRDAVNSLGKCPSPMPEYSPSATKQSKNR